MQIKTVGVLGCGLMGAGIAQVSAAAGYKTIVREVDDAFLQKGLGRIKKFLDDGVAKGKVRRARCHHRQSVRHDDVRRAEAVDLIIEAIIENVDEKADVDALERIVGPHTISSQTPRRCASPNWRRRRSGRSGSAASISSTRTADETRRGDRALTTSDDVSGGVHVCEVAGRSDHRPRSTGFIVNRLLVPYLSTRFALRERAWDARRHRRGHEARMRLSDGSVHAARFRRPRHDLLHREHHVRRVPRAAARAARSSSGWSWRRLGRKSGTDFRV